MPQIQPLYDPAQAFTGKANGAAVVGARVLAVAAAKTDGNPVPVKHCGVSDQPIGVSGHDAAQDTVVTVYPGQVLPITCSAAVTAGTAVEVTATGKVAGLASGNRFGVALSTTSAADQLLMVQIQS